MAKHEYFIDEQSKKRSTATYAKLIDAKDIQPIFSLEKGQAIKVYQKEDIEVRERKFCFLAVIDDDAFTSPITIEDASRFITLGLSGVIFRDNLFPIALTWKTPSGDTETYVCIFDSDEAIIRFTGTSWAPVGPASVIKINSNKEQTGDGAAYQVYYNHFLLNEVYGCRIFGEIVNYIEPFGIHWLVNALEYRYDCIELAKAKENK